jgi:hypothetical protein
MALLFLLILPVVSFTKAQTVVFRGQLSYLILTDPGLTLHQMMMGPRLFQLRHLIMEFIFHMMEVITG